MHFVHKNDGTDIGDEIWLRSLKSRHSLRYNVAFTSFHLVVLCSSLKFVEISKMASGRTKTIEEIDDISEMFQAMAALDISCRGLKTLDQMKAKAKEVLNATVDKPSWTAGQVRILQLEFTESATLN